MIMKIEETKGYKLAMSFKPFIDPKCSEHMEIVKDMAKSINNAIGFEVGIAEKLIKDTQTNSDNELSDRVKQLLSALDYDKLTDYQAKCVLMVTKLL